MGNDLISIDTGDFVLFQSSFPRGERPSSSTRIPFLSQFQSTFPRGERRRETKKAMFGWAFQSTFPRGERRSLSCIFIHDELFQSTFPRGERLRYGSIDGNSIKFQSTFPRGERQNVCRLFLIFCHFNPRSRVGNDAIALIPPIIPPISIHVPAWGTT